MTLTSQFGSSVETAGNVSTDPLSVLGADTSESTPGVNVEALF